MVVQILCSHQLLVELWVGDGDVPIGTPFFMPWLEASRYLSWSGSRRTSRNGVDWYSGFDLLRQNNPMLQNWLVQRNFKRGSRNQLLPVHVVTIFTKWFSFSCVEHFGKQQILNETSLGWFPLVSPHACAWNSALVGRCRGLCRPATIQLASRSHWGPQNMIPRYTK